jgi:hypothetical protein
MREKFRLLVHESTGQSYQDLFVKIMGLAEQSFKPVKAHGNIGDRGNDGWCPNEGRYYQVYAPEDLPSNNASSIKKMKNDFSKIISFWCPLSPIRQFVFVVNDKYKGVPHHIYDALSELKRLHNLKSAEVFLAADMERLLFDQSHDVINSVLGGINSEKTEKSIYGNLVDEITKKMHLKFWPAISENLIADSIQSVVIRGFLDASILVFKTALPNTIPSFEVSVKELIERSDALCSHFTDSEFAFLSDNMKWWQRDMRWKRVWIKDRNEYLRKYHLHDKWSSQLLILHYNFVHALNLFSIEVIAHINPGYFMGQKFTVRDSLGTYNELRGYEAIPGGFREIN